MSEPEYVYGYGRTKHILARRADEVYIGKVEVGSNIIPIEPAERLRNMAEALS